MRFWASFSPNQAMKCSAQGCVAVCENTTGRISKFGLCISGQFLAPGLRATTFQEKLSPSTNTAHLHSTMFELKQQCRPASPICVMCSVITAAWGWAEFIQKVCLNFLPIGSFWTFFVSIHDFSHPITTKKIQSSNKIKWQLTDVSKSKVLQADNASFYTAG